MMPGMRLGWITSTPFFHQHLVTLNDCSTQHPHGFGQIFITEMLSSSGWQLSGFDRWVRSLRKEYERRRDVFLDAFESEVASTGLASAEPPQAGMFVWVDVHIRQHPPPARPSCFSPAPPLAALAPNRFHPISSRKPLPLNISPQEDLSQHLSRT